MEVISDFHFKLDKKVVTNIIRSYSEFATDKEINSVFDALLPILYESVKPAAIFTIDKKEKDFQFNVISDCNYIVYCVITIGDKITRKVNELFSCGKMKEAVALDAMATSYLFEISSQLFNHIHNKTKELGLGLSCRIAPGDGEIPLWYQRTILDKLKADKLLGIHILNDCMLSSLRSMSYIYGADETMNFNKKDHDCSRCGNKNYCNMRKI